MTENELFDLIAFGDVNDPETVKRIAATKIAPAALERVRRRILEKIGIDFEMAWDDGGGR